MWLAAMPGTVSTRSGDDGTLADTNTYNSSTTSQGTDNDNTTTTAMQRPSVGAGAGAENSLDFDAGDMIDALLAETDVTAPSIRNSKPAAAAASSSGSNSASYTPSGKPPQPTSRSGRGVEQTGSSSRNFAPRPPPRGMSGTVWATSPRPTLNTYTSRRRRWAGGGASAASGTAPAPQSQAPAPAWNSNRSLLSTGSVSGRSGATGVNSGSSMTSITSSSDSSSDDDDDEGNDKVSGGFGRRKASGMAWGGRNHGGGGGNGRGLSNRRLRASRRNGNDTSSGSSDSSMVHRRGMTRQKSTSVLFGAVQSTRSDWSDYSTNLSPRAPATERSSDSHGVSPRARRMQQLEESSGGGDDSLSALMATPRSVALTPRDVLPPQNGGGDGIALGTSTRGLQFSPLVDPETQSGSWREVTEGGGGGGGSSSSSSSGAARTKRHSRLAQELSHTRVKMGQAVLASSYAPTRPRKGSSDGVGISTGSNSSATSYRPSPYSGKGSRNSPSPAVPPLRSGGPTPQQMHRGLPARDDSPDATGFGGTSQHRPRQGRGLASTHGALRLTKPSTAAVGQRGGSGIGGIGSGSIAVTPIVGEPRRSPRLLGAGGTLSQVADFGATTGSATVTPRHAAGSRASTSMSGSEVGGTSTLSASEMSMFGMTARHSRTSSTSGTAVVSSRAFPQGGSGSNNNTGGGVGAKPPPSLQALRGPSFRLATAATMSLMSPRMRSDSSPSHYNSSH